VDSWIHCSVWLGFPVVPVCSVKRFTGCVHRNGFWSQPTSKEFVQEASVWLQVFHQNYQYYPSDKNPGREYARGDARPNPGELRKLSGRVGCGMRRILQNPDPLPELKLRFSIPYPTLKPEKLATS